MKNILIFLYRTLTSFYLFNSLYSLFISKILKGCGKNLQLTFDTRITGRKNIKIGDDFISMGGAKLYADNGELIIGNNCDLNTNVQLGAGSGRIVLGNDITIAANVVIRSANHGIKRGEKIKDQPSKGEEIIIGDDVWVGSNAVILSGVTLAKGSIVGAGAVVTKSSQPYEILAGVPARKIGVR